MTLIGRVGAEWRTRGPRGFAAFVARRIWQVRDDVLFECTLPVGTPLRSAPLRVVCVDRHNLGSTATANVEGSILSAENFAYREAIRGRDLLFAATDDSHQVSSYGFVLFESFYKRVLGEEADVPMISNCFTRPEQRGRGLYSRLLISMAHSLSERGFTRVIITCAPDNIASLRGIQRAGFRHVRTQRSVVVLARWIVRQTRLPNAVEAHSTAPGKLKTGCPMTSTNPVDSALPASSVNPAPTVAECMLSFEEVTGVYGLSGLRAALPAAASHADLFDNMDLGGPFGGVWVGRREHQICLLVPRVLRSLGLPIRFGEKVLWRMNVDTARVLPSAAGGVPSRDHAIALLRWLRSTHPGLALAFTDVMTDTPLYEAMAAATDLGYRVLNNDPAPHLFHRFEASYEAFFDSKPSKYKNHFRKNDKVMRARLGSDFALREYRSPAEVASFLKAADLINKKTYQFKLFGERVDHDAQSIAHHSAEASTGRFRSFVLWHNDIPLSFVLGWQGRDGVFEHRQTGYDPDWRDCVPGINCNILMLQHLYANDRPRVLDFGSGDADYKRMFANVTRMSASPLLLPRTLRYLPHQLLHSGSSHLNGWAVAALERLGIKDRVKRLLRRQS